MNASGAQMPAPASRERKVSGDLKSSVKGSRQTMAIDATAATLQADGVCFERPPHLVAKMPDHELWMAFFRDPDSNLLALMEERRSFAAA